MKTRGLNLLIILVFGVLTAGLTGCATDISGKSYSDEHVGETARSLPGVVVKVRRVKVGPDQLGKNKTGAVAGGLGGALLGSTMGGGRGKGLMTIGGAVAGAVGGAYAEKALKTQTGLEITVKLKNGEYVTVVQGSDIGFRRGEQVFVMVYNRGRSKVVKNDEEET
jgi:outer membrane lipoprotein SlyB